MILYVILVNSLVLFYLLKRKCFLGTDHSAHISIINRIKINKNGFLKDYIFFLNEKYPSYPQLFHWALSYLPQIIYEKKFNYINLLVKAIEVIIFNLFLIFLYKKMGFENITFLFANLVFNVFPFSYSTWNAKNFGLSARGIGLVSGHIYLYLLIVYIITGNQWVIISLIVIIFIILLLSQMAMQFVLFSLPFIAIVFSLYELILMPFLSFALFYFMMPKVAINYLIGQFNHKRNYALFTSKIFILKNRPSIYRDFIYDFWINLRKDWRKGLLYIYHNPIIELLYGFIFLWFVLFIGFSNGYDSTLTILFNIVLIALALFFLTSFRYTRFLGEPQRYLEFTIPLITIIISVNLNLSLLLLLVFASVLFIIPNSIIIKAKKVSDKNVIREEISNYLESFSINNFGLCISNDKQLLKYISGKGIPFCRPDFTIFYKNANDFFKYYYDNNIEQLSPYALKEYYEKFDVKFLIINNQIYTAPHIQNSIDFSELQLIKSIGRYEIYHKIT